ncbi:phosphotransferase [Rathayibacter soli]|uniref:phosphotransferase n=1 Tax=Rathayibacter soli TaxID=3144168 RepID=UPI0027E58A28|nr:phosphotransferase [Glaciibacter superstes]
MTDTAALPEFNDPGGEEVPLLGGDVTDGLVRVGDTVRRPRGSAPSAVPRLLTALASIGFAGAPRYLGVDAQNRDVLTYLTGEVAGRPWPAWVADESRIASVARLVRAYDDAVAPLGVPEWARAMRMPDPPGTPPSIAGTPVLIGHLDITPENVVFTNGRASALIDFDLARPATRAEEVCNMLLWWGAWMPPADREPVLRNTDASARAAVLVNAYRLDPADRARLVALSINGADRSWHLMKYRSETLGGGWRRMWDAGVGERIRRRQFWLERNRSTLDAAVTATPAAEAQ